MQDIKALNPLIAPVRVFFEALRLKPMPEAEAVISEEMFNIGVLEMARKVLQSGGEELMSGGDQERLKWAGIVPWAGAALSCGLNGEYVAAARSLGTALLLMRMPEARATEWALALMR